MTQLINYAALNDFLDNQTDDISSVYLWYERLSEYDIDGTESPRELETLFHAMKFLMSFSFTSAEELREVAEREAVQMAEKEEAWEEQKIALKEELDAIRERITISADAGDSSEAFRAQIDALREENRELEKTNRDRDREMADLRDRFENLVSRADVLARERDALEQHRNQMEDTIRELQRRISAKSDESTKEWESRKLRQRNEQAVTLTRQLQAVVLQNDELREEVTRVGEALEEATRVINGSAARYAQLTALYDAAQRDLRNLNEENTIMRQKLEASSSMLMAAETEAADTEKTATAKIRELEEANRGLRDELYGAKREAENLRQLAESMNMEEREAELEKLRTELIEATKTARALYGEMTTSKTSADPTVSFQLKIMQLEKQLEQCNEKIATHKATIEELQSTLESKDEMNSQLSAELDKIMQMKFGDAREEIKRMSTQLSFRDTQIAQLSNLCTMLQIELEQYADKAPQTQVEQTSEGKKKQETQTQTNGMQPDVVPHHERPTERKTRKPSKIRPKAEELKKEAMDRRKVLGEDVWEQQAMLIAGLYSELMFILEEQEIKKKQISDMEEALSNGRRAMDTAKSQLRAAFEEIYRLKKDASSVQESDDFQATPEFKELERLASSIGPGSTDLEKKAEEAVRRLIGEQIERLRLTRSNAVLRRRCARAEHVMRRARERMVVVETQSGKRCAQLQYQLDTTLIDLASCQSKLVRSVSIERYEKLAMLYKKECMAEVVGGDLNETWNDSVSTTSAPVDPRVEELEAKNAYLKKIVEVLSEQNDFWSKETEILQNENEELKRFVEEVENESDLKNILGSIEQRLLETIREQQEGLRDYEREYRKAREAEENLARGHREWAAERSRLVFSIKTLQSALSRTQLNSLNSLSLEQIERLKAKIREVRQAELSINESKNKIESIRTELEQQLTIQKSVRKAKETVEEENAVAYKLERRIQTVYTSLEQQTIAADQLRNTVNLKDRQLADLKDELDDVRKENEQLLTAIANISFSAKLPLEQNTSSYKAVRNQVAKDSTDKPVTEEPQSSNGGSEEYSTDSDNDAVKTILQDNSKDFEKQLKRMKEAAEVCIQSYKQQLLQKEEALRIFRELAEEKLTTSSGPIVEKEVVREEVRVKDEEMEERLKHSFGEVARLKEELEELEKANQVLYKRRRCDSPPTVVTVECQTDIFEEQIPQLDDASGEKKEITKITPEIDNPFPDANKKSEAERARYKNEIKALQAKLRRMAANNKELMLTCEKIREDALAEIDSKKSRMMDPEEQIVVKIRMDLEKTRKENKTLQKTIDEQKLIIDNLSRTVAQQKNTGTEVITWHERKKTEESLNSTRKKLDAALKREKGLRERLDLRERLLSDMRRNEEQREKELERYQRKLKQVLSEKAVTIISSEAVEMEECLKKQSTELEEKDKEIAMLSLQLQSVQEELSVIKNDYKNVKIELQHLSEKLNVRKRELSVQTCEIRTMSKAVEVEERDLGQQSQRTQPKVIVATDDTIVFQLRETKNHMQRMGARLVEMEENLAICENDRRRLIDANKRLMERLDQYSGAPGAVSALCDKIEAKNKEIAHLKAHIRRLEKKPLG